MQTKFKVWLTMLVLFISVISFSNHQPVKAATNQITIDGDVSDWATVPKVTASKGAQVALTVDNNYLYWYVSVKPNQASYQQGETPELAYWERFNLQVGNKKYTLAPKNLAGNWAPISQTPGQKTKVDIEIAGASHSNIGDNEGFISAVAPNNNGYPYNHVFEGRIALSDLELASGQLTFTLSNNGQDGPHNVGAYQVSTTYHYVDPDEATGGDYTGQPNIVIDGSFDDWAHVKKTKLIKSDDANNVHLGALIQYGGNLYLYINMDPHRGANYAHFQPESYYFTIGGQEHLYHIVSADGSAYQQLNQVNASEKVVLKDNGAKQTVVAGSTGYVTHVATSTGGQTDILEIKIPVQSLATSSTDGQQITFRNPALGDQTLTVTGGSTGPILLAAGGFGIALFGIWQFNRRKKRAEELTL